MPKNEQPGSGSKEMVFEQVPTVHDFSPAAIKKALKRNARNHWGTRYSGVLLLLSILAGGLFGFSELIFFSIVGTVGIGCISWVYNYYIKAGNFELRYVERLRRALEQQTHRKRQRLKQDLVEVGCQEGARQLDQLWNKFDSLAELLADKLDTGELTYNRYYGIAQEVLLSGIDNLTAVVSALKSVSEIDVKHINQRLKLLGEDRNKDPDIEEEFVALEKRLELRQRQLDKVKHLLLENEKAMTQLDETTAAIADMDTVRGEAEVDMENSMLALAEITERAQHYSL